MGQITIMGGELFKDGRLVLSIEFDRKSLTTPVYLKMDSPDGLFLSEGVCRQLGIINYHDEVRPVKDSKKDGG